MKATLVDRAPGQPTRDRLDIWISPRVSISPQQAMLRTLAFLHDPWGDADWPGYQSILAILLRAGAVVVVSEYASLFRINDALPPTLTLDPLARPKRLNAWGTPRGAAPREPETPAPGG